ncbi:prepilin-type N-terminal cleavage/methylation domain-containing protein [Shewanella psychropiezotolerans]|uniref:Type II secretion system protein H n=1 Tax=Shewanella psychropiezotolerans TaxID=2593655 RepID=A0ABX5X2X9_9GAMM|nr:MULTISPECIES: GspH/FimT family pseudopilin [Shewanella]MPY20997.1 prepilin-type N-terminal cleavage/methylation domain-containing protein [Shewanella sp. YLB-07]MPY21784.1 prepilin-type N-terminal cleavage/methylation domain-containing protein [Shewanella sp. YLB-07]QDO85323.1 prepilin-type N-terminal cleavage/methylation domain-containing protein [Shewanella psychropiezotolerans]
MKKNNGFTLVELMTTLVISTTLISIAVPNFNSLYAHYRADSSIRVIQQTLQMARNSAISYGVRVTVCPIIENQCSDDWTIGITVFIDSGASNVIDGQDEVLMKTASFYHEDFVTYNRSAIRFQADGLASGTNGTLKYCPSSTRSEYSKAVIINQSGRIRFSKAAIIECR